MKSDSQLRGQWRAGSLTPNGLPSSGRADMAAGVCPGSLDPSSRTRRRWSTEQNKDLLPSQTDDDPLRATGPPPTQGKGKGTCPQSSKSSASDERKEAAGSRASNTQARSAVPLINPQDLRPGCSRCVVCGRGSTGQATLAWVECRLGQVWLSGTLPKGLPAH